MLLQILTVALNVTKEADVAKLLDRLINWSVEVGKDVIGALLIYIIGRFIIKQISRLLAKLLEKRKLEVSVQTFLKSLVNLLLNMVMAFAIIGKLGVETTSFAALLASAGVAIGMALSGNLSNFAGGLIILVFKPFRVGDYIDGPGASGTVKEIQIFHTIIATTDNRIVFVPNGQMSSNAVTNYSKMSTRRLEWTTYYSRTVHRVRRAWCQQRRYQGTRMGKCCRLLGCPLRYE